MENTLFLSCGVLENEILALISSGDVQGSLKSLDSILHMRPLALDEVLLKRIQETDSAEGRIILVYGDCCPRIHEMETPRIRRIPVINCAQALVGKDRYRELMKDEAFLLLPEWAPRWEEVFKVEMGLTKSIATEMMGENRRELVYLDTGILPVPDAELEKFSSFTGLPLRIERVGLSHLRAVLLQTIHSFGAPGETV